jgi:hypothetical protein
MHARSPFALVLVATALAAVPATADTSGGARRRAGDTTIVSMVRARFVTHTSATSILDFKVVNVPTGATLRMTCAGETCAFKTKAVQHKGKQADADLVDWFGNRALTPGTVLELRITKPGLTGRMFRWHMQEGKYPKSKVLCLPPGASRPVACA